MKALNLIVIIVLSLSVVSCNTPHYKLKAVGSSTAFISAEYAPGYHVGDTVNCKNVDGCIITEVIGGDKYSADSLRPTPVSVLDTIAPVKGIVWPAEIYAIETTDTLKAYMDKDSVLHVEYYNAKSDHIDWSKYERVR